MKILLTGLCCFINIITVFSQTTDIKPAIIPVPVSVSSGKGVFVFPKQVLIGVSSEEKLHSVIELLDDRLMKTAGMKLTIHEVAEKADIRLLLNQTPNAVIGQEGYQLSVTPKQIVIKGNTAAGIYYGVQTLLQLFPAEIESASRVDNMKWEIPCVEITDYPRFAWRGLMFDVARHFFTVQEVKKYIDEMARYKFNILHFHLTDDEGWRIEIKGLPRLTEVGAWNVKKVGYFGTFSKPDADEPRNYGGFYTQANIRDLVQYAKDRFINILPEVDVPGHSLAAVASYPELSCTPEAIDYKVNSGEQLKDWTVHPPIALVDNTLCPANEKVYAFLDTVITQLAQLFPFEYIHMGGDECSKNFWQESDAIKGLMKKEGLKNYEEVQSYFEKRVEKIVESKGKKFIGWDEILEGGLAANAAVMSWRGTKNGIAATKMGHEVVMSPANFAYLDYMQADPVIEPKVYSSLHLSKAYQFDPAPDGADVKYVLGGQANLWSEQLYNIRTVEYMTWPRGLAIAESVWSQKRQKDWNDFFQRAEKHFDRFDAAEIKYSRAVYDPIFTISRRDTTLTIELSTEVPGLDIHYSFDNSFPDRFYPKYEGPLTPPKDAVMLRVITYRGKTPVGRLLSMPVAEIKRRADQKINYP